ncbi:myosin light chain kinase, smooth muscle-like [Patiria miniata]|uniref:Protein kinase domain-containing protein n=1 Tax=Patiria miniata TaxID=46514 RepID=A0A913Z101_PATMI|nr:myosin light chain kinase, smooth muscle-like [Patiria miniata]
MGRADRTSSFRMSPIVRTPEPVQGLHSSHHKSRTQYTDAGHDYVKFHKDRINEQLQRTSHSKAGGASDTFPLKPEEGNCGYCYILADETCMVEDEFNKQSNEQVGADREENNEKAAVLDETEKDHLDNKYLLSFVSLCGLGRKDSSLFKDTEGFLGKYLEDQCSKLKPEDTLKEIVQESEPEKEPDDTQILEERVKKLAEEANKDKIDEGNSKAYQNKTRETDMEDGIVRESKPEKEPDNRQILEESLEKPAEEASDDKRDEANSKADQDKEIGKTDVEDGGPLKAAEELDGGPLISTKEQDGGLLIASEEQAGTKTAEKPDAKQHRGKKNSAKRRKRTRKPNQGVDRVKSLQKKTQKALSITEPAKVKKVANGSGGKGEAKTDGHPNQTNGGNGKTCTRARAGDGRNSAKQSNSDDDEDGDERRKPRHTNTTKKTCGRQAHKRKRPKKESSKGSRSPSPKPGSVKDMDWVSQGTRPKNRPRGGPGGDKSGPRPPKVEKESPSVRKLQQQMQCMSLGRDAHITAHLSENPSPAGKPMPRTRQNHQAVVKMYHDDGIRAHREVALSMPSGLRWRGASAMPGDLQVAMSAEVSPRSVEAQVAEDARADEVPQPPEVPPEVVIPPGVSHGEPRHLMVFADHVRQLKDHVLQLKDHNPEELCGQHEGVLLDKALIVEDGQFRDGLQYTKLDFLGRGSFGNVYLIQDRNSGKKVVAKQVPVRAFAPAEVTLWCVSDHPGIVPLLGVLRTDDMVTFISGYEPGSRTLQSVINQAVLGQGRALRIMGQVLQALAYLHSRQIVHKDIKTDNLLILPGARDRVKVIDFGLATRLTAPEHTDDVLKGTECYMSPEIAGGEAYDARTDVWSSGCTFVCMISGHPPWSQRFKGVPTKLYVIAVSGPPLEDIPHNTDPRVRCFIEQTLKKDFQKRPTAAQAWQILPLDIAEELENTLAIEHDEPEPEPMDVQRDIPEDAFPGPLTPWTPRGPQDGFRPFPQRQDPPPANRPAPDMSLSFLFIPGDGEPRQDKRSDVPNSEMEVDEEDMYGPPPDLDSPETFVKDAFKARPSEVSSGTSSVNPRSVARQLSLNAANFESPFNGHLKDAQQNSQATSSFMLDTAGNPFGFNGDSQSFELEPMSLGGSLEECHSISTAHALMFEASQMPSLENALWNEADVAGAAGFDTSGVDTNSPGLSAEDQHFASLTETVQSTSTAVPGGIVAVVGIEGKEPFRMRLKPDYSGRELAEAIVGLQHYKDSKLAMRAFTLCWKDTGDVLHLNHTFGCGEHQLVAVAAPEGDDWPWWRINNSGRITKTE